MEKALLLLLFSRGEARGQRVQAVNVKVTKPASEAVSRGSVVISSLSVIDLQFPGHSPGAEDRGMRC